LVFPTNNDNQSPFIDGVYSLFGNSEIIAFITFKKLSRVQEKPW